MSNLLNYIKSLEARNNALPENLNNLRRELEDILERTIQEAGVINPGYFSYFLPILENYRNAKIITRYHISEEQYNDSYSGKVYKIPVVDVFLNDGWTSNRIFLMQKNLF